MEHRGAVDRRRPEDSALAKHQAQMHSGQAPMFSGRIVGGSLKNLERYVGESLFIERRHLNGGVVLMNGKGEWGRLALPRIDVTSVDFR